jgi:hypothetical protein
MTKLYKAKVIAKTTVNNEPTKIGDVVEVDKNTLRNLVAKGRLEAIDKVPEKPEADAKDVPLKNRPIK